MGNPAFAWTICSCSPLCKILRNIIRHSINLLSFCMAIILPPLSEIFTHTHAHAHSQHVCMSTCVRVTLYVYMYVSVMCVYVCLCLYVCFYETR